MTLFDMTGKVAVITGSTRGIGRAIAERMAEHGAKVVVSSRKQDVCDQVTKEINDRFGKGTALAVAANISSKENLQNLVDESKRAFGQIDVLVCNAASNPYYGPLAGISDDQFNKILSNNIVANNWLTSMVVPDMIARKDGNDAQSDDRSVAPAARHGAVRAVPDSQTFDRTHHHGDSAVAGAAADVADRNYADPRTDAVAAAHHGDAEVVQPVESSFSTSAAVGIDGAAPIRCTQIDAAALA